MDHHEILWSGCDPCFCHDRIAAKRYLLLRGGDVFGYALLWCFVGGTLRKGIPVYSAARYITLTGEHPMTHWGYLPGPRNWVPLVIGILKHHLLSILACRLAIDPG